jgi:hypothetical protein
MSTAAINTEPVTAPDVIPSVREAQTNFENKRNARSTAETEATKAQKLVEYMDEVRRKHFAEEPSISKVLPKHPRVVEWQAERDAIQKLFNEAVADRDLKRGQAFQATEAEKVAHRHWAQCALADANREIEELEPKLVMLNAARVQGQQNRNVIQARINGITSELENACPPNLESMAAFDPRRKRWEKESAPWLAARKQLIDERDNLSVPDLGEIVVIKNRIDNLKDRVIPNLENAIAGNPEFRGGVFRVVL